MLRVDYFILKLMEDIDTALLELNDSGVDNSTNLDK